MIEAKHPNQLIEKLQQLAKQQRLFVAITGAPGAGKSTLVKTLCRALNQDEEVATVVPMDGYHLDNNILQARDWLARKGAPYTFDATALACDLERIVDEEHVFVPVFDRELDCSRAFAQEVTPAHRIILVEGNYLCCKEAPWQNIATGFDVHIHIHASRETLEKRLIQRWLDHGLDTEQSTQRVQLNDMPNVDWVEQHNSEPDILYTPID